jgi:hypothetical protein
MRLLLFAAAILITAGGAFAQTYVATRAPNPCPPGGVVVTLADGRQACAQSVTPPENPLPKANTSIINGARK